MQTYPDDTGFLSVHPDCHSPVSYTHLIGPVVLAALIFTVIGAGVPLVVYCVVGKQTIVELSLIHI